MISDIEESVFPLAQSQLGGFRGSEFGMKFLTIPPRFTPFGPLRLFLDTGVGYRVWLGEFTLTYFDHDGSPASIRAAADQALQLLSDVVADRVVCYRHRFIRGGGYFYRAYRPPRFLALCGRDFCIWSGPWTGVEG